MQVSVAYMMIENPNTDNERMIDTGEDPMHEPFTDDLGRLFKFAQKEWGRCVSKVYIDTAEGPKACGWVFRKRRAYDDDRTKSYVQEAWVTLHERADEVTRKSFPLFIS